ncbi:MAG: S8 family serine peptidase [Bdellovibrionales bacterium]|nr:S8 family serine peptidase [Bdellovibrionales bacterium]
MTRWIVIVWLNLGAFLSLAQNFDGYLVQVKNGHERQFALWKTETLLLSATQIHSLKTEDRRIYWISTHHPELLSAKWVQYYEPNYLVEAYQQPEDPLFEVSWGLKNLGNNEPRRRGGLFPVPGVPGSDSNIFPAWQLTKGDPQIKIAIIDTGVDYTHPDLAENIWINPAEAFGVSGVDDDGNGYIDDIHGYDFANHDGDPFDDNFHGTHVAGIIGARHNQVGLPGVMAHVSIIPIKFMDHEGRGNIAQAIEAVTYAIKVGAKIMNNSWGTLGRSQILYDLFQSTQSSQTLIVAAAGNSWLDNDSNPRYPSNFDLDNLISVAAYNAENRLTGFSCFGPKTVDLAAPGRNIISTVPDGRYEVLSGTSMSAPYVSAAIGLYRSRSPHSSYQKVKSDLLETATPVDHLKGKILTEGRLNIGHFVGRADKE